MRSVKFLDELKERQGFKNDVAICKLLGWSSAQISQYRSGKRIMDNEACVALAIALKTDPIKIIMAADIDRAERAGQKSLWEVFTARTTATAASAALAVLAVNLFLTPQKAEAAPRLASSSIEQPSNLYYVKLEAKISDSMGGL